MSLLTDLASPLPKPCGCIPPKPEPNSPADQATGTSARAARRSLPSWIARSRPQSLLSLPFIYSMIVPLVMLDLWFSLYQAVGFPLFGIATVRRHDHFVMDRARLPYLNMVEKAHCAYCSYANGVLSFAREIAARTEQYWCPIKHGRLPVDVHDRYVAFLDYGDGVGYEDRAQALRTDLTAEPREPASTQSGPKERPTDAAE